MVNYCPECGGEMRYISLTKHYVCQSCGLSCTGQELNDFHDKRQPDYDTDDDARAARRKEYLKWYLSSKK
jgi:transcription initiation factor TFIIIB Brf1 subunit/transcription initiation factor TFIIB